MLINFARLTRLLFAEESVKNYSLTRLIRTKYINKDSQKYVTFCHFKNDLKKFHQLFRKKNIITRGGKKILAKALSHNIKNRNLVLVPFQALNRILKNRKPNSYFFKPRVRAFANELKILQIFCAAPYNAYF